MLQRWLRAVSRQMRSSSLANSHAGLRCKTTIEKIEKMASGMSRRLRMSHCKQARHCITAEVLAASAGRRRPNPVNY